MKKIMLAAAALVTFLTASASHAQLTGPSVLNSIGDNCSRYGYSVESGSNTVVMKDASTGTMVFTVSQVNSQTITLRGVVASMRNLTPEQRTQLQRRIALFNYSSHVGTLWLDNATGEVTMEHHLNPRHLSPSTMATIATSFGDVARAEGQILMQ